MAVAHSDCAVITIKCFDIVGMRLAIEYAVASMMKQNSEATVSPLRGRGSMARANRLPPDLALLYRANAQAKREYRLPRYSEWGAYALIYVTPHGGVLCPSCVRDDIEVGRYGPGGYKAGGLAMFCEIYWEGPVISCGGCGEELESAYGEPEETKCHDKN